MAASTSAPTPEFPELGISGLTRWGGTSRVYEEFLKELQGPQGMKNYREMMDNCPITGAILFAAYNLSRHVTFRFDAADSSDDAERVAKFVESAIFDDLGGTWTDTLSEILSMLGFGWALTEIVCKRRLGESEAGRSQRSAVGHLMREAAPDKPGLADTPRPPFVPSRFNDGLIGFKSWALRSQETLFQWEFAEDSSAIAMQQMAPPDYRLRRIPLTKSLLFRASVAKNNPEGRSILRTGWTSYWYKKHIQRIEAIGIERDLAGYPYFQTAAPTPGGPPVPDIWNPNDANAKATLDKLKDMVRKVRRDEQEGAVLPWWVKFELLSTGSRRQFDTNAIVTRYEQRIAMAVLADFIMIGHDGVGSKALASTKSSLFTDALSGFLDNICSVVNRFAIPLLLELNGLPLRLQPMLVHGDVESVDAADLGNYIKNLSGAGMPLFPDADLQEALLEAVKLPTSGVTDPNAALSMETGGLEAGTSGGTVDDAGVPQPAAPPSALSSPAPAAGQGISRRITRRARAKVHRALAAAAARSGRG